MTTTTTLSGAPAAAAALPAAPRRLWEIDAMRGLMLVLMTLTHIPSRFSDPLGQPFGFVSAAEGFVLLSGFMAGMVYTQRQQRSGEAAMRDAFLRRAAKIYVCQAALLIFLLSAVALWAVIANQHAITDMLSFFLDKPFTALVGGLLLMYNPPLLDILPMYVLFMLASPMLMLHGAHHGWAGIVIVSALVWLAAQFGLSALAHAGLVQLLGLPIPFRETGAFQMLAWQFLWVIGLWMGSRHANGQPAQPAPFPRWAVRVALAFALVHLVWRHLVGQLPFPDLPEMNVPYDKWQLGPMRLLDVLALLLLAMNYHERLVRWLPRVPVLENLGQASLPVFCAHLVLALTVLTLSGPADPGRALWRDLCLLVGCFAVLYAVALGSREMDRRNALVRQRLKARREARTQ